MVLGSYSSSSSSKRKVNIMAVQYMLSDHVIVSELTI